MYNEKWLENFKIAKAYYDKNGSLSVPRNFKTKDGINYDKDGIALEYWVIRQRQAYKEGRLSDDKKKLLDSIEMKWNPQEINDDNWDENYELAKEYYKKHKNLLIPMKYKTESGKKLGSWIVAQRQAYKKKKLSDYKIKKLELIKMVWNTIELSWNEAFKLAKKYYKKYGNLSVPYNFKTKNGIDYDKDGFNLSGWIALQKQAYRGNGSGKIKDDQIKKLESIGMIWDIRNYKWNEYYESAKEYYNEHKNLIIPSGYKTKDGFGLGGWIISQRTLYKNKKLTDEQIKLLESIGMVWEGNHDIKWMNNYELAKKFYNKYHHLRIPNDFKTKNGIDYDKDGFALGSWMVTQRRIYKKLKPGRLEDYQIELLEKIEMVWEVDVQKRVQISSDTVWMKKYELVKEYYEKNGNINIPLNYMLKDKKGKRIIKLGQWFNNQKALHQNKELSEERTKLLEKFNINWNIDAVCNKNGTVSLNDLKWNYKYDLAKKYYEKYGNLDIPYDFITSDGINKNSNGVRLGIWIDLQRKLYRNYNGYSLSDDKIKLLQDIGMIWFKNKNDEKLQKEKITKENKNRKEIEILNRFKSYLLSFNQNNLINNEEINKGFVKHLEKH